MNRDEIIRMAREAELLDSDGTGYCPIGYIERFAALVAAAAAKREWQGLTDEDIGLVSDEFLEGVLWAEAKLKEKNA